MLLAVDIGNTQTGVALFDGETLAGRWTLSTCASDTADEIALKLDGLIGGAGGAAGGTSGRPGGAGGGRPGEAAIACVVPPLTDAWCEATWRVCGGREGGASRPLVVGPGVKTGLAMRFDNPAEVGADRVCDAVAAVHLHGAPVIVVDLGTATNIEVIDRDGAFCGGIIADGIGTSAADLAARAARLPLVDLGLPGHVIGTNTADAMRSGIVYGELARIDGLVRRIEDELGYDTTVVATGGFGPLMAGLSETIDTCENDLALVGLRLIHERNRAR